jgi:hypothetical protein
VGADHVKRAFAFDHRFRQYGRIQVVGLLMWMGRPVFRR